MSLQRVNQALSDGTVTAGASILFARNGRFQGALDLRNLGAGSPENPTTLGAFCEGDAPVLTGLSTLEWERAGPNQWRAQCEACPDDLNLVTMGNTPTHKARWPNSDDADGGFLLMTALQDSQIVSEPELAGANWTGGEFVFRRQEWIINVVGILDHSGQSLTVETIPNITSHFPVGYFIQNHPDALDQDGEWVWDAATNTMTIHLASGDPVSREVRVSTEPLILDMRQASAISLNDLAVEGGNAANIALSDCNAVTLAGVDSRMTGGTNIDGDRCRTLQIGTSQFDWSLDLGLDVRNCVDCSVTQSAITNTATFPGMGENDDGHYIAARIGGITGQGAPFRFEDNRVSDVGYIGVDIRGPAQVSRNVVEGYCSAKVDGAGIYTFRSLGDVQISQNIVRDGRGLEAGGIAQSIIRDHGIYIDDGSQDVQVVGNQIVRAGSTGIKLHNTQDVVVFDNQIVDHREAPIELIDDHLNAFSNTQLSIAENVLVDLEQSEVLFVSSRDQLYDVQGIGSFSDNTYCSPFHAEAIRIQIENNAPASGNLPLEDWSGTFGHDASSTACPLALSPLQETSRGPALIANADFDANTEDWTSGPNSGAQLSWEPSNGGRARLTQNDTSAEYAQAQSSIGPLDAGTVVRVDMLAALSDGSSGRVELFIQDGTNGSTVSNTTQLALTETPQTRSVFLQSNSAVSDAVLVFRFPASDLPATIDGAQAWQVEATERADGARVIVETNASQSEQAFEVPTDSVDVDGTLFTAGEILMIPPYGAAILFPTAPRISADPSSE